MSIAVWITDGCNLRCRYCWQADRRVGNSPRFMNYQTWNRTLDFLARNFTNPAVSFFGAEPLLNPNLFMDFVTTAANRGISSFSVTSNCVNFRGELAEFFSRYRIRLLASYDGMDQVVN